MHGVVAQLISRGFEKGEVLNPLSIRGLSLGTLWAQIPVERVADTQKRVLRDAE